MTDDLQDTPEAEARRLAIDLAQEARLADAGERLYAEILESLKTRMGRDVEPDVPGLAQDLQQALTRYAPAAAEVRRRRGSG
ncbi:MAG: hypothetical protein RIB45_16390 [Marivibrio sp.]|uniref:hypothetical protein n=1 Tax=Marivibrio sp. TaxID=2039719 RepID=UPI0032EECFD7